MLRSINVVPPRDLFTLWWKERWIRLLVLSLIPVSVIDALFTLLLVEEMGVAAEVNPIGQWLLGSGNWAVWLVFNCSGFALFCMLTGSYYLAAREHTGEPDTGLLVFLISLRVGMMSYNITYYFVEPLGAGYPPVWAGLIGSTLSYLLLSRLLSLSHDLSWKRFRLQVGSRLDSLRDTRLVSSAGQRQETGPDSATLKGRGTAETHSFPSPMSRKAAWAKRGKYIALWVFAFFATMLILQGMLIVSGLWDWTERTPGWVSLDGAWFLAFFGVVMAFIAVSIGLIVKAFDVTEYPV